MITGDNIGGTELAIRYLIGLGHRRIAYVQGSPSFTAAAARVEGFRRACAEAGLDPAATPIIEGDGLFEGGFPRRSRRSTPVALTSPPSPATTT